MEALERELNRRCDASPFRVGLFLKDLATGVVLRRNADAIVLMIIVSDSTATGMMADLLGLDAINDHCRRIGLANTFQRFGATRRTIRWTRRRT